jgi:outer membrane protein assembly factor BamA
LITATVFLFTACKNPYYTFATDPDYKNKKMLYSQKSNGHKHFESDHITDLYKQKAQYKIGFTTPYLYIHFLGKMFYDTASIKKKINALEIKYDQKLADDELTEKKRGRIEKRKNKKIKKKLNTLTNGNWMMASFGEFPSIYDSSVIELTKNNIHAYLHTKGHFRNHVEVKTDSSKHKCFVVYDIHEGPLYRYSEIEFEIENKKIDSLVKFSKGKLINKGDGYDESLIEEERDRIYKMIKNHGYYDFTKPYINFKVDTTNGNHHVKLVYVIQNPEDDVHKQYYIKEVIYTPNSGNDNLVAKDTINSKFKIKYVKKGKKYNTKILDYRLQVKPNSLFNLDSLQRTQFQLGSMEMFRFVNINMVKNSTGDSLSMYVYTSPLKKFQIAQEYGINVMQGVIPGPYFSLSFKDRNVFNNYEIFDLAARYSIEGQASVLDNKTKLQTTEWSVAGTFTFPMLYVPTKIRFKSSKYNPKTRLGVGYLSVDRPEYKRKAFNTSLSYIWQKNQFKFFKLSIIDISVINSDIKMQEFYDYLQDLKNQGNNLYLSFNPSIVTNVNFSYTFSNSVLGSKKSSWYVRPYIELGGLGTYLISKHLINNPSDPSINGLQHYQYIKTQLDLRYYKPINKKNTVATRLNIGFSMPLAFDQRYQTSKDVLPYEKYFFSGGSNSIRAWQYRRLGPGSYIDPNNPYKYEQPGEILIETSYEYRRKLYRFFESALFVDIGNTWAIADATRPGSSFKFLKSVPELAVGSGVGLRLNFTFIIVRFDLAWKVWNPAGNLTKNFVLLEPKNLKSPILNFSIGYPF